MRLSERLAGLGDSLYYHPSLAPIVGGATACLVLLRLVQWTGYQADPAGWIYKEREELAAETGLTLKQLDGARTRLRKLGLITEHYSRLEHRLKFLVSFETLERLWAERPQTSSVRPHFQKGQMAISQKGESRVPKKPSGESPKGGFDNKETTKTAKETTTTPLPPTVASDQATTAQVDRSSSLFLKITGEKYGFSVADAAQWIGKRGEAVIAADLDHLDRQVTKRANSRKPILDRRAWLLAYWRAGGTAPPVAKPVAIKDYVYRDTPDDPAVVARHYPGRAAMVAAAMAAPSAPTSPVSSATTPLTAVSAKAAVVAALAENGFPSPESFLREVAPAEPVRRERWVAPP